MPDREVYIDQVDYDWVEKNHKPIAKKLRENMIHKLTLQDTATYRNLGLESTGKFKKFDKENNSLRYCNGSCYKFEDKTLDAEYKKWYDGLSESTKFNMFYGNGVVD